jgi:uncharacterized caspase-like protein
MFTKVMFFFIFILMGCSHHPSVSNETPKKVALVIGNQHYVGNELDNPINDAIGVSQSLRKIGFDVTLVLDITLHELNETLKDLEKKIEAENTIVFIYFAGHGNTLQKNSSEQFLMMTDKEQPILVSIFKFYDFFKRVHARHSIMAIDACRDYQKHYIALNDSKNSKKLKNFRGNFNLEKFRAGAIRYDDGIKKDIDVLLDREYDYKLPNSVLVSYATERNQRAKDWSIYDPLHSPYSYALMQHLDDEEVPIEEVFRRVRVSMLKETNRQQSNSEEMKLEKNIWLVPKKAQVALAPPI